MFRLLLLHAISATALFAQTGPIPAPVVRNAASRSTTIAPGSYVSVSVAPIGFSFSPDSIVTLTAAGSEPVRLTAIVPPNATTTAPGPFELWFVIPANTRLGPATITTAWADTTYSSTIEIAEAAPGLFTNTYTGSGPALALNHPSTRNSLTSAAVPNGIVTLFGTGLNGVRTADVRVELAGHSIVPLYAGPQGQAGLDQINFVVPPNTMIGCYVAVAIRVRGVLSNQATLSINGDSFACAHPLGLTYSDLKTLDTGGSIPLAQFSIGNDVTSPQAPREVASLLIAPANAAVVALQAEVQTSDADAFSCSTSGVGGLASRAGFLPRSDAGEVALTGPGGKRLLLSSGPVAAYYYAEAPTDQLPFFTQGAWRLAATGGPDLRAFQVDFALPPPLQFSNFSDRTIVPSQGYTVRWLPFNTGSIVSVNLFGTGVFATCAAPDWAGQLLLPAAVLERFKGSSTTFVSIVRPRPQARTMFSIPVNTGEPIRGVAGWGLSQRITAMVQ